MRIKWVMVEDAGIPHEKALRWARAGLLLCDLGETWAIANRKREERLYKEGWHARAATYYFLAKWKGVRLFNSVNLDDPNPYLSAVEQLAKQFQKIPKSHLEELPPMFWHHPIVGPVIRLPEPTLAGYQDRTFLDVIEGRCSEREFALSPLSLELLSNVLAIAFRPLGIYQSSFYDAVHKVPPAGGGLHPAEAFVIVSNVSDLEPGLYHYRQDEHALHLIATLDSMQAKLRQVEYAAGQPYALHASAGIIVGQRFYRHFWKYRRIDRALLVLGMDVGAIVQTLYLAASLFNLGGFYTAAVNSTDIEEDLKLEGSEISVFGIYYLGPPRKRTLRDRYYRPLDKWLKPAKSS